MLFNNLFHLPKKFATRQHDTMVATLAFDPNIHAHPDNLPPIRATWMLLFHFHYIMKIEFFFFQFLSP